jgi:hypothetical protein
MNAFEGHHQYVQVYKSFWRLLEVSDGSAQWRTQDFFEGGGGGLTPGIFSGWRDSTNSVLDRGQRKRGSEALAPYLGIQLIL